MADGTSNERWLDSFAAPVAGGTNIQLHSGGKVADAGKTSLFGDDVEIVSIRSLSFWRRSLAADAFFWLLAVASFGLIPLFAISLSTPFFCKIRYKRTTQSDPHAELVLVESLDEIFTLVHIATLDRHSAGRGWLPVASLQGLDASEDRPRSFEWRSERFWWHKGSWTRYRFNLGAPISKLHEHGAVCSFEDKAKDQSPVASLWERRNLTYGANTLHIDVPSFGALLGKEVLKPFFVFQLFSFVLWFFFQSYYIYASLILVLSVTSATYEAFLTWKHFRSIKKLAETECMVTRLVAVPDASGYPRLQAESVSSRALMPGDLLQLEAGMVLPCDLLLLAGQCVVNESMLTGESAPVLKTSLPLDAGDTRLRPASEADSKFRLLSGTTVLQARALGAPPGRVADWSPRDGTTPTCIWNLAGMKRAPKKGLAMPTVAMVAGTGFSTAKGELVRAILYPKPSSYDFEKKLYYFIANLVLFAAIACGITIAYQAGKLPVSRIIMNCLNIITITIPPALPLSLSIGLSIAFTRLSKHGIFCISPPRIINAGRVNTLCFDKTGTLTRDGLTMRGVLPVSQTPAQAQRQVPAQAAFGNFADDMPKLYAAGAAAQEGSSGAAALPQRPPPQLSLSQVLAACHSLSVLHPPGPSPSFPELQLHKGTGPRVSRGSEGRHMGGGGFLGLGWGAGAGVRQTSSYEQTHIGGSSSISPEWDGRGEAGEDEGPEEEDEDDATFVGIDGRLSAFVGDPLEVQMFRASGWSILYRPSEGPGTDDDPLSPSTSVSVHADPSDPNQVFDSPYVPPYADTIVFPPELPSRHEEVEDLRRAQGTSGREGGEGEGEGEGERGDAPGYMLVVMRRFDFDSEIRRMSVLVSRVPKGGARASGDNEAQMSPPDLMLLVKGAPETLQPLCDPATLPQDFENRLQELALNGNRVLAAAARPLPGMALEQAMQARRDELEQGLSFVGFLVLENELKHETVGYLDMFASAGLRSIMVTGDNPLTAIAVARKCGGSHFLLRTRRTLLLDCPKQDGAGASARAQLHSLDAGLGPDSGLSATGCVLTEPSGQRSFPLDDLFHGSGPASQESSPRAQGGRGEPRPLLATSEAHGVDLVVTGRAFEALRVHHESRVAAAEALSGTASTSAILGSLSLGAPQAPATPLEAVLARAGVFARMSAGNKQDLMLSLRAMGYSVCMTGDGANDSGALKAADVGVSIAAKQQRQQPRKGGWTRGRGRSVAGGDGVEMVRRGAAALASDKDNSVSAAPSIAAPFSTSSHHIGAVLQVLMEGRCTLVSAVVMFKYMLFYGVIQTMALVVLYPYLLELTEAQYLWADLGLVFPMVFLMPAIPPKRQLSRGLPEGNLMASSVFVSTYGQCAFIVAFQLLASLFLQFQSWYYQPSPGDPGFSKSVNMHSTESFYFSSFQYTFLALALSQSFGKFRVYLHRCYLLVAVLVAQLALTSLFLLAPTDGIIATFGLYDLRPYPDFRLALWILALLNGAAACLFERFAVRHTSTEPETLTSSRRALHGHSDSRHDLQLRDGAGGSWLEKLRSWWEDNGGCLFPSCRPGAMPRYASVLDQTDAHWERL